MNKIKPTELKEVQATEVKTPTQEVNIESLISQAITNNISVDVMERLLTIRRELKAEKAKEEYDKAMAAFQAECPTIEKKKQGYNYKYAPLESIIEQVKGLLSKNGFSYTFDTGDATNAVVVYCKVKHIAGHMETSQAKIEREVTTKMNSSQQSGSSMTYGKRYAFVNAFGILTGDEDIDAATSPAEDNKQQSTKKQTYSQPSEPKQQNIHIPNGMTKIALTQCNLCHAPAGKPHASKCTAVDEEPIDINEVEKGILKQKEIPAFNNK